MSQLGVWYMHVMEAFGRRMQKNHKFEASLGYRARLCLTKTKPNQNKITTIKPHIY
jgi:hypothetical protein